MKKTLFAGAVLLFGVSISLTAGAPRAAAQGPAGSGASAAAQESSHSFNPINWIKKDPKDSPDAPRTRSDVEKKLTPGLQAQGLLPANTSVTDACTPFSTLEECLAALHASHNLSLSFICVRAASTGVHTSADVSGCKVADGDKPLGLAKTIHQLKPEGNSKQAAKDAEQQALSDLKGVGA